MIVISALAFIALIVCLVVALKSGASASHAPVNQVPDSSNYAKSNQNLKGI